MRKLLIIAWREYYYNLRRPAFLFAAFGTPLIVVLSFFLSSGFGQSNTVDLTTYGQVGYVDLSDAQVLAAGVLPEEVPGLFVRYDNEESARAALEDGTLTAYFTLPAAYLRTGRVNLYSYDPVPENVVEQIDRLLLLNLSADLDNDIPIELIRNPAGSMLVELADSGRVINEGGIVFLVMLPLLFSVLLLLSSMTTSGFLMSGLVDEKSNRIIEVLVTSVTPMQLLAGKILGLCLLGLTQVLTLLGVGFAGLALAQRLDFLEGVIFPVDLAILGIIYYLLSYFLLASFMAGVGAVAGSEQESRQLSAIITFPFIFPFFFLAAFIIDPNSNFAVALSLFPLTAPMTVMLRVGLTAVPFWQIAVGIGLLALTVLLTMWLAARVFRWGLLLYGKRLNVREVIGMLRRRDTGQMATTAAHSTEGAS